MISKDKISSVKNLRRMDEFPGWVMNGHAMLLVGEGVAASFEPWESKPNRVAGAAEYIAMLNDGSCGTVVEEDAGKRIAYVAGDFVECQECEGRGDFDSTDCDCPHCTGDHECKKCNGIGATGTISEDFGQVVFKAKVGDNDAMINGMYVGVVDGATVRFMNEKQVFLVSNSSGVGVAIIMLFMGQARTP